MFRGGRRRGQNFGILLLGMQMMNFGFDKIPPVTLISIIGQVAIFLGFGDLDRWFGSVRDVCISTHLVVSQRQWSRLLLGTLVHASDMHLQHAGEEVPESLLCLHVGCVHISIQRPVSVIFALKVLTVHYSPRGLHYALGFIPVPSRYIYWLELGLIQIIYPNASFTGHLAGILVGVLYIKGPLKMIMDGFMSPEPSYTYTQGTTNRQPTGRGYTTGRGSERMYEDYTGGLSEEEQIRRATRQSQQENFRPNGEERLYPDLDDLRRRRADRYT
ncbi:RHBL4-like protein [Mya arenaria]|uniref:RHBL4-like protein n=1 Tax=Mya arenaria TaxID=6604 RepID=A0ABY7G338_MYAAR|nr:RHBL4-like protein [Mya arenaria]